MAVHQLKGEYRLVCVILGKELSQHKYYLHTCYLAKRKYQSENDCLLNKIDVYQVTEIPRFDDY